MESSLKMDKCFIHRFIGHHEMAKYYEIHPGSPIVDGEYDGTKESFETMVFELLSTQKLRDYGLLHQLPFIIRNMITAFEEEKLEDIAEMNIVHYGNKLMRLRNTRGNKEKLEVLHFDIADFFEYLHKESMTSKASKAKIFAKKFNFGPCLSRFAVERVLIIGGALGLFALLSEIVRRW